MFMRLEYIGVNENFTGSAIRKFKTEKNGENDTATHPKAFSSGTIITHPSLPTIMPDRQLLNPALYKPTSAVSLMT